MNQIITVDEKNYSLKYNEQVIETIEAITGKGFMEILIGKKPVLSLADLKQYISNALYSEEGGKVPQVQGVKVYEALLHSKGYMFLNMLVIETIQRDCPFFFLAS